MKSRWVFQIVGCPAFALVMVVMLDASDILIRRDRAFCSAAFNGNISRMKLLLFLHSNVNCYPGGTVPPLESAAIGGQVEAVRFLLEHGASVNQKDKFGDTALEAAYAPSSRHHSDEIIKLLAAAGGVRTRTDN
jgi:ankyrin repeat protein